jgi:2-amino-4-hydroxy-6-hydroxymethyldihydropteridine diphosphokinase
VTRVYLSIGSNIDREINLRSCVRQIKENFRTLTLSSVYQTRAIGFEGNDFYNMVIGFDSTSKVGAIHTTLRKIEDAHGRRRGVDKLRPRPLDIDLLLYGDLVRHCDNFNIPRKEIVRYAFVLLPLSEIAAELIHPETGQAIGEIWRAFDAGSQPITKIELEFE